MKKHEILSIICAILWSLLLIWDIGNCIMGQPASWTSLIGSEALLVLHFWTVSWRDIKKYKENK